ncbi:2-dehydro-3-deoxygluconate kinase [hydrothermal vent metagenome]|uniref:2-dehydro-3-deoxygluconate kinase n=1 Tax=hydrothermal vent metagenome TaxID=652676 RepID=A0A3B1BYQ1_9ZZZZ
MRNIVKYNGIKSSDSCKYDGVSLGEVMLRIDPYDVPTARAKRFRVSQGGGETNVACGLSYTFGLRSTVLTALVDDNIGMNIRNQLREVGVDTSNIIWFNINNDGSAHSTDQKGGLTNGINFTYNGKGIIPSDTVYYRAHSAIREIKPSDFDWDKIFGEDGVRVFNTGGIFTLLSENSAKVAMEAVQKANEYGTLVVADLNYRAKVQPNKSIARSINKEIAPYLGFLVGNDSDLSDALGYETITKRGSTFEEWVEAYKVTVKKVAKDFPNLSLIGTQWRDAINADLIHWGAVLYDAINDEFYVAPLRENIPIADRTGGGDSFTSGVLSALMYGKDLQTAVEWGAAHGILVQETPGDFTMVTVKDIEREVKRAKSGGGVKAVR